MDLPTLVKSSLSLHSAFIMLAVLWLAVSIISDPQSRDKKSCIPTNDNKHLSFMALTSILISLILYVQYMHISSVLTRPADENSHPTISKGVGILIATYFVGVFMCGIMSVACCLLGFEILMGRIGCQPIVIQVILIGLAAMYGLVCIWLLYHAYRELLARMTPPVPAPPSSAAPVEQMAQIAVPATTQLTTMTTTTTGPMTTIVRRDAQDTMDITEEVEDIV